MRVRGLVPGGLEKKKWIREEKKRQFPNVENRNMQYWREKKAKSEEGGALQKKQKRKHASDLKSRRTRRSGRLV